MSDTGASVGKLYNSGSSTLEISGSNGIYVNGNIGFGVQNPSASVHISASANPLRIEGLAAGTATTSSYLAVDSNKNIVLTSSSGGAGATQIGAPEDGDYTDGIFADFTSTTAIGTAVDRFNELFSVLVPSPAPNISSLDYNNTAGISLELSFDSANAVSGYTAHAATSGFSQLSINNTYESATNSGNFRLGVYNGTQEVTGTINYNVAQNLEGSNVNYPADSFGDGNKGVIRLFVNHLTTPIHFLSLSAFTGAGSPGSGTGTSLNGQGSGFISVSTTGNARDSNNKQFDLFQHRTAKVVIDPSSQRKGYNYAFVKHVIGSTTHTSNYLEWINDTDANSLALSVANPRVSSITKGGSKYISGVQYHTGATLVYNAEISNFYKHTYDNAAAVSVNGTNVNSRSHAVPTIGGSENSSKVIQITSSHNITATELYNGSTLIKIASLAHPLKTNLTDTGSVSSTGFLIHNVSSPANNNLSETFIDEDFRVASAAYPNQSDISSATWNSQHHMTSSGATGHTDGLIFFDQKLYSPVNTSLPNNGNFSTLTNGPAGNPNYSGITGTRTFLRKVQNTSGATIRDIKLTSQKSGTKFSNASLDTDDVHFFVKIPGSTGWMDVSQNFVYGSVADGNGALINTATDNSSTTGTGNSVHCLTFGTESVSNNQYLAIKMEADESWSGYLDQLDFQLGASDTNNVAAPPNLSNIGQNITGVSAKLSFGASNAITGYQNVSVDVGSGTDDINDNFNVSGNRRGVFTSFQAVTGTLNDSVSALSNRYVADAVNNGDSGAIQLWINGTKKHEIDITSLSFGTGSVGSGTGVNKNNTTGSGFQNISKVGYATHSDGIPDYTKPYRTMKYVIHPNDNRLGHNYAKIQHVISGVTSSTNHIEWAVDTDTAALSAASVALGNFGHSSLFYSSGVKYFATRRTASYTYAASNVYKNVYSSNASAVSFPTTTNCSVTNIAINGTGVTNKSVSAASTTLASLDGGTANCEQQVIQVTGTVLFDHSTSLVGDSTFTGGGTHSVSVNSSIIHPHKSNLTTSTQSKSNFLVFNGSAGSTNANTEEYFNLETYRIVSGSHATQAAATGSAQVWNSQTSMNDVGSHASHSDGLLVFNGFLISPIKGGSSGDFRNVADGGTLQSPPSNVNYSTGVLTNATRTFYRHYRNNTTNDRSSITVTLYGSGSLVNKQTSLGNNGNFYMEVKVPGNTAYLDGGKAYTSNNKDVDGSGALVGGSSPTVISTSGTSVTSTFNGGTQRGTVSVSGGDVVVIKISAHKDWKGYLSRLKVAYS